MRSFAFVLATAFGLALAAPLPVMAQGTGAESAAPSRERTRAARPRREPTAGQMAARERMRKCGSEWREAKTKGSTGGLKWPQYYSRCNARLKGNSA